MGQSSSASPITHVELADVRRWQQQGVTLSHYVRSIGRGSIDPDYVENSLGLPLHLRFAIERLQAERGEVSASAFDAVPFYSLCKGLFLPLSGIQPNKVAHLFGIEADSSDDSSEHEARSEAQRRESIIERFLAKDLGLNLPHKLACLLGDPFMGKPSTFRRDSLIGLLLSFELTSRRALLDRLTRVGEVAALFAQSRAEMRGDPPLTALEVIEALRPLPTQGRLLKQAVLRSLFARCGKLEAYFLARLLLRRAGLGADYQGPLIARALAEHFQAPVDQVAHAIALTDAFLVARTLESEGSAGLGRIQLQPLVPIRPALAGGTVDAQQPFPSWVERKYDGIRLMLHKSTDARGSTLCAAYTRNRADWMEQAPGLAMTIRALPARSAIVDGELHGTLLTASGPRPGTVYDVYAALQGDKAGSISLRFAAFDLIYLDGRDMTELPLSARRDTLARLVDPLGAWPLAVPIALAEGQLAQDRNDLNRLYEHFRGQGYEGVIIKDLTSPYRLASRDPSWLKRKRTVTLDLVLLGAVMAVTTKEQSSMFGSYVIAARRPDGSFEDVGDVAGVDRERDAAIQREIMREGLLTGRRIERQGASGTRPGLELRPHIVVTVKFSGIVHHEATRRYSLRDPKLLAIRADKPASEVDAVATLERLHLRDRLG